MKRATRPSVQSQPCARRALEQRTEIAVLRVRRITTSRTTTTPTMAMTRKMRCQSSGTASDVIAAMENAATRMTLITPIAVRSKIVDAVETGAGTRSSSSTTRSGSLARPRIVKYDTASAARRTRKSRQNAGPLARREATRTSRACAAGATPRSGAAPAAAAPPSCRASRSVASRSMKSSVTPNRATPAAMAAREIQVGIDRVIDRAPCRADSRGSGARR